MGQPFSGFFHLLVIVQARFSSARLPGKVLRPLAGRAILGRVLDRIGGAEKVTGIIVATSTEPSDDAVAAFCEHEGVPCFRGPLDNVAERYRLAAKHCSADSFIRISGDSPLIVPQLIDQAIDLYQSENVDLATNVMLRSFPSGMSVEAVRCEALRRVQAMMIAGEAEHVTSAFYRRSADFRIANFSSRHPWGAVRLSVDTQMDFDAVAQVIDMAGARLPALTVADLVALRQSVSASALVPPTP